MWCPSCTDAESRQVTRVIAGSGSGCDDQGTSCQISAPRFVLMSQSYDTLLAMTSDMHLYWWRASMNASPQIVVVRGQQIPQSSSGQLLLRAISPRTGVVLDKSTGQYYRINLVRDNSTMSTVAELSGPHQFRTASSGTPVSARDLRTESSQIMTLVISSDGQVYQWNNPADSSAATDGLLTALPRINSGEENTTATSSTSSTALVDRSAVIRIKYQYNENGTLSPVMSGIVAYGSAPAELYTLPADMPLDYSADPTEFDTSRTLLIIQGVLHPLFIVPLFIASLIRLVWTIRIRKDQTLSGLSWLIGFGVSHHLASGYHFFLFWLIACVRANLSTVEWHYSSRMWQYPSNLVTETFQQFALYLQYSIALLLSLVTVAFLITLFAEQYRKHSKIKQNVHWCILTVTVALFCVLSMVMLMTLGLSYVTLVTVSFDLEQRSGTSLGLVSSVFDSLLVSAVNALRPLVKPFGAKKFELWLCELFGAVLLWIPSVGSSVVVELLQWVKFLRGRKDIVANLARSWGSSSSAKQAPSSSSYKSMY